MKIVINKCYGGFSLSGDAIERYLYETGKKCYWFKCDYDFDGGYKYTATDKSHADRIGVMAYTVPNPWDEEDDFYDRDIPRNDPVLVKIVEELGDKANGRFAQLHIVDIPDEINWEVEEYDGMEWISEIHQRWN